MSLTTEQIHSTQLKRLIKQLVAKADALAAKSDAHHAENMAHHKAAEEDRRAAEKVASERDDRQEELLAGVENLKTGVAAVLGKQDALSAEQVNDGQKGLAADVHRMHVDVVERQKATGEDREGAAKGCKLNIFGDVFNGRYAAVRLRSEIIQYWKRD